MSISNLDELRDHLQTAVEIEWSTIPPYLCALWSIEEGTNVEAGRRPGSTCHRGIPDSLWANPIHSVSSQ